MTGSCREMETHLNSLQSPSLCAAGRDHEPVSLQQHPTMERQQLHTTYETRAYFDQPIDRMRKDTRSGYADSQVYDATGGLLETGPQGRHRKNTYRTPYQQRNFARHNALYLIYSLHVARVTWTVRRSEYRKPAMGIVRLSQIRTY